MSRSKKVHEIKRQQPVSCGVVRTLRECLREIDNKDVTNVTIVYERRCGDIVSDYSCNDKLRHLGALEFAKSRIWK